MRLAPSLLIVALAAGLTAVESSGPQVGDMRIYGATGQSVGTYTITTVVEGFPTETKRSDAVLRQRVGILGIGSLGSIDGFGAPLIGVSLSQHQIRTDDSRLVHTDPDLIQVPSEGLATATIFALHLGWGVHLTRGLHVEATVHGGYGGFTGEETITAGGEASRWHSSRNGWYGEIGVTGTLAYTFSSGIQCFVQGSYIKGEGENSIKEKKSTSGGTTVTTTLVGGYVDGEYELDDAIVSAGLGYRF